MRRASLLLSLTILSAALSGCKIEHISFDLGLGGGGDSELGPASTGSSDRDVDPNPSVICFRPLPDGAKRELIALGYEPAKQPILHAWLTSQGQLRQQLPECTTK